MSTKAIRELADLACARWPEAAEKALAEVAAVEKAAKHWWDDNSRRHSRSMTPEDKATLERIAKDAP